MPLSYGASASKSVRQAIASDANSSLDEGFDLGFEITGQEIVFR